MRRAVQVRTLLVAPTERDHATKTGDYDMSVVFDYSRKPRLGELLQQQAEMQLRVANVTASNDEGQEKMWEFGPKAYVKEWQAAVRRSASPTSARRITRPRTAGRHETSRANVARRQKWWPEDGGRLAPLSGTTRNHYA